MDERRTNGSPISSAGVLRKRRVRVHRSGITMKRFLLITAAALITSLLIVAFGVLFDIPEDRTYRPKDIEGRYHELQKMKEVVEKEMLPAKDGR